jgi:hypothetical protein
MQPLPNLACPLCGGPNDCRAAQSGSFDGHCWCADVAVDPAALARVPPDERDRACLCRRCATGEPGHAGP